jgi:prophage tail gpP-like protein
MTQSFDLRINGKSELIKQGLLQTQFDTALDGFTASIVLDSVNNPDLYAAVQPYAAPPVEIYLEDELMFTGKLTLPANRKTPASNTSEIRGFAGTFNFVDSHLIPPYERRGYNLRDWAVELAKQTNTPVIFEGDPGGVFFRETVEKGQSGFVFLAPLAKTRNRVIGNTEKGELIFRQANTSSQPVAVIEEGFTVIQKEFGAAFDLRKRFRTYKTTIRNPFSRTSAVVSDKNITEPRHKIIETDSQAPGAANQSAAWLKNIALVEELSQEIEVLGWRPAPNKPLWRHNTLVTIKSKTMSIPDGFTYFINRVDYSQTSDTKKAILSIIPPQVYTGEPIAEPWFL